MKKNTRYRLLEIRRVAILAITFVALVLSRPAFAGQISPVHTLDITENSSTSLTVLFDLTNVTTSVVTLNSPDHWTLTFDPSIQFGGFFNHWFEPGDPTEDNVVGTNGGGNVLDVFSDLPGPVGGEVPDGTPQQQNINVNGQQGLVFVTFHDLGDAGVVGVPENVSTLALFLLSLVALFGANRLRSGWFA